MKQMVLREDIRSITEFRANTTAFIDQVNKTGRPIVLTKNGKSSAVLMDTNEYDEIKSMREMMETMKDVTIALKQMEEGKGIPHKEAKEMLLERYRGWK